MLLWTSLSGAGPWDVTFEPEQARAADFGLGSRSVVIVVDDEATPAANALCGAMAAKRMLCQQIPVGGRTAKMPDIELVMSQRPEGAELVYVVSLARGSKTAALVSAFDGAGNRLDWYVATPGQAVLLQAQVKELTARVNELQARPPELQERQKPSELDAGKEAEAKALLKEATAAYEAMEVDRARELLEQIARDFPNSRVDRSSQRLKTEIDIIGKAEIPLTIEHWFQGEGDIHIGQPTLYVFWEVWCPHCKREVPKLQGTYERYRSRGFQILALTKMSEGATSDRVSAFLADYHVSFPVAKEDGATLSDYYGVRGVPAVAMVIDGRVVWRGHPAKINDDIMEKWLAR